MRFCLFETLHDSSRHNSIILCQTLKLEAELVCLQTKPSHLHTLAVEVVHEEDEIFNVSLDRRNLTRSTFTRRRVYLVKSYFYAYSLSGC